MTVTKEEFRSKIFQLAAQRDKEKESMYKGYISKAVVRMKRRRGNCRIRGFLNG